jgi:hypothetical protein
MEPDFDISLNTPEDAASDEAKGHFLESLGLSERNLFGEPSADRSETSGDEGVVLSSMPDDLGFPAQGKAPDRNVSLSYSISVQKDRKTARAISLPVEEAPQPEPEEATSELTFPDSPQAQDPDETLHLQCPECRGSLVLSRRYLGVEGACVWCHTPIVAAESARDGQVRIFPILGHGPSAPAQEETKSAIKLTIPSVDSKALPAEEPAPEVLSKPSAEEVTVPASPEADDRLEEPAPEETPQSRLNEPSQADLIETPVNPEVTVPSEIVADGGGFSPPDLDSLYDTGGFLSAQIVPAPPAGLGETLLTPQVEQAPEEALVAEATTVGFESTPQTSGEFTNYDGIAGTPALSDANSGASHHFLTPTPWGPPTPIAGQTAPVAEVVPVEVPTGFASGFAAADLQAPETDAAPSPLPAPVPSWDSAFGGLTGPSPAITPSQPPVSEAVESKGSNEGFLDAGFATPATAALFGSVGDASMPQADRFPAPISNSPKFSHEIKSQDESRAFLPPFHAFATGSSSDEESGSARNLFGDPAPAASLWSTDTFADEAPTLLAPLPSIPAPVPSPPLFATVDEDSSPFGEFNPDDSPTAFTDFKVDDSNQTTAESGMTAPVENPPPSATFPPAPVSEPEIAGPLAGAVPPAMPQVTSQPLGAKPKPVVRKSFIILMVVIVGFASGAALASFVLPVEEYVSAARSYMDSKFGTGAAIPQMPAIPEGMTTLPKA